MGDWRLQQVFLVFCVDYAAEVLRGEGAIFLAFDVFDSLTENHFIGRTVERKAMLSIHCPHQIHLHDDLAVAAHTGNNLSTRPPHSHVYMITGHSVQPVLHDQIQRLIVSPMNHFRKLKWILYNIQQILTYHARNSMPLVSPDHLLPLLAFPIGKPLLLIGHKDPVQQFGCQAFELLVGQEILNFDEARAVNLEAPV